MAVLLSRAYATFASGAVVIGPDDTEAALIAQGYGSAVAGFTDSFPVGSFGNATLNVGGNLVQVGAGPAGAPAVPQGPRILPNTNIQAFATLGTNTTLVAGTTLFSEIFVPHWAQWTGLAVLNGTTVGTDNGLVALYDTNGVLVANSAVAGVLAAGADAFQNRSFLTAPLLAPGRYFGAYQSNGTTATIRTHAAANGGNQMVGSATGTFGTVLATITVPTTFTTGVGPIFRLFQT